MTDYIAQNKKAWEYNAYDFWCSHNGSPAELAEKLKADPLKAIKRHAVYFDAIRGLRIANICGSCGKKAIPLALLGGDVTVFDISEQNRRYALEVAEAAGVRLTIRWATCWRSTWQSTAAASTWCSWRAASSPTSTTCGSSWASCTVCSSPAAS